MQRSIFVITTFILLITFLSMISCSLASIAGSGTEGINDDLIPYPRAKAIIPLNTGNTWTFNHTILDSTGTELLSKQSLHLEIGRAYGLENDSTLIALASLDSIVKFKEYVFEYEYDYINTGRLISYRDTFADTAGVYFRGTYEGENRTLYDQPILWLKYPSIPGDIWYFPKSDSTDTIPHYMETIDTNRTLSIPVMVQSATPTQEELCYLYKETNGEQVNYYYYSKRYGPVAFLSYINNVLHRTYMITSHNF